MRLHGEAGQRQPAPGRGVCPQTVINGRGCHPSFYDAGGICLFLKYHHWLHFFLIPNNNLLLYLSFSLQCFSSPCGCHGYRSPGCSSRIRRAQGGRPRWTVRLRHWLLAVDAGCGKSGCE